MNDTTEDKPVSVGDWILTFIVLGIPVVNLVLLLIWAFGSTTHPSSKIYAKAILILVVVAIAIGGVCLLIALPSALSHPPAPQ
jgi:hypothetical protein